MNSKTQDSIMREIYTEEELNQLEDTMKMIVGMKNNQMPDDEIYQQIEQYIEKIKRRVLR